MGIVRAADWDREPLFPIPKQGKFSCEDGRGLRWRAGALSVKNPAPCQVADSAVIGFRFLS
jgi:hypothetical protein